MLLHLLDPFLLLLTPLLVLLLLLIMNGLFVFRVVSELQGVDALAKCLQSDFKIAPPLQPVNQVLKLLPLYIDFVVSHEHLQLVSSNKSLLFGGDGVECLILDQRIELLSADVQKLFVVDALLHQPNEQHHWISV